MLLPLPGFLGYFFWDDLVIWIAVPTSIITGFLLPLTYLGLLKLQRSRAYPGEDLPAGRRVAVSG